SFVLIPSLKVMTEYDFSPEAYQAHLENMNRISRWVDRTEGYRAEFGNAAALIEDQRERSSRNSSPSHSPERRNGLSGRRRKSPPPLPLHAYGTPDLMYGMIPYASPIHPADDRNFGFFYGRGAGSPGTMPVSSSDDAPNYVPGSGITTAKSATSSPKTFPQRPSKFVQLYVT
ncbi:hypothetical protein C0993_009589, partial [Termitomyces sp. T159_Od127]